jgi:hypothetical protein
MCTFLRLTARNRRPLLVASPGETHRGDALRPLVGMDIREDEESAILDAGT